MANIQKVKESKSLRFKPHRNEALGKYYGNKADYLADMKKGGYEPYDGKEPPSKVKKYQRSDHLSEVSKAIRAQTKNGVFKPSGALQAQLIKDKVIIKQSEVQKMRQELSSQGGFR